MANHTPLALGDYTDYKYYPFHDVAARLVSILSEQGFAVKCTEDRRELQVEHLSEYDVVLSYVDGWEKMLAILSYRTNFICPSSSQPTI